MTATYYCPVASCLGTDSPEAAKYDKRWLVIDESGAWLTSIQNARLSQVQVAIRLGFLVVRAPGMLRMDIPLEVIEDDDSVRRQAFVAGQRIDVVDEGDVAAVWMSGFLGAPSRLVKVHPDASPIVWPAL